MYLRLKGTMKEVMEVHFFNKSYLESLMLDTLTADAWIHRVHQVTFNQPSSCQLLMKYQIGCATCLIGSYLDFILLPAAVSSELLNTYRMCCTVPHGGLCAPFASALLGDLLNSI